MIRWSSKFQDFKIQENVFCETITKNFQCTSAQLCLSSTAGNVRNCIQGLPCFQYKHFLRHLIRKPNFDDSLCCWSDAWHETHTSKPAPSKANFHFDPLHKPAKHLAKSHLPIDTPLLPTCADCKKQRHQLQHRSRPHVCLYSLNPSCLWANCLGNWQVNAYVSVVMR